MSETTTTPTFMTRDGILVPPGTTVYFSRHRILNNPANPCEMPVSVEERCSARVNQDGYAVSYRDGERMLIPLAQCDFNQHIINIEPLNP